MKLIQVIINIISFLILLVLLFGRSFMGLYIFNFRIGELVIGFAIFSFFVFVYYFKTFIKVYGKNIAYSHLILLFSFIVSALVSGLNFNNLYTLKASSYLWATFILYSGLMYFSYLKITRLKISILQISLVYAYILTSVNYPRVIIDFFTINSDKWDFNKASSIALFFVVTLALSNEFLFFKKFSIDYFILISALFLPLFLYMSRGSFIGVLIFIFFQVYKLRKIIIKDKLRYLIIFLISVPVFFLSSLNLVGREYIEETSPIEAVTDVIENKNTLSVFLSFYIDDTNRLKSLDGNLNWRLEIWQDIIDDSVKNNDVFLGQGYKDIIYAMDTPARRGFDGLNENVHNFIFNIYARGGLLQLIIFIVFYLFIMYQKNSNEKNFNIISIMIPLSFISFFDSSMENAHFPIIYYLLISFYFFRYKAEKI